MFPRRLDAPYMLVATWILLKKASGVIPVSLFNPAYPPPEPAWNPLNRKRGSVLEVVAIIFVRLFVAPWGYILMSYILGSPIVETISQGYKVSWEVPMPLLVVDFALE